MKEQSPSPAPSAAPSQCYVNRELSWLQFNRRVLGNKFHDIFKTEQSNKA